MPDTWMDRYIQISTDFKKSGKNPDEFADTLGIKRDHLIRIISVSSFPPDLRQEIVRKGWYGTSVMLLLRFAVKKGRKKTRDFSEIERIVQEVAPQGKTNLRKLLDERYREFKLKLALEEVQEILRESGVSPKELFGSDGSAEILNDAVEERLSAIIIELDKKEREIGRLQNDLRQKQTATILQQLATLRKNTGQFAELCYAISENRHLMTPDQALEFQESISYFSITVKRVLMLFQGEVEISIG